MSNNQNPEPRKPKGNRVLFHFTKHWSKYMAGDTAGFNAETCEKLEAAGLGFTDASKAKADLATSGNAGSKKGKKKKK